MLAHFLRELRRRLGGTVDGATANPVSAADAAQTLVARGEALFLAGDHEHAASAFREVLAANPRNDVALHALGVIAHLHGDTREAVSRFTAAIEENPGVAAYHNNCGEAYRSLPELERALACYDKAVALAPEYVHPHVNRGIVLAASARYEEAIAAYETAIRLEPENANAHFGLATTLLTLERYERGWQEFSWRRALHGQRSIEPQLKKAPWTGEALPQGTLLLYAEQGYGDAIQFVRYAALAAERCARVLIKCHAELDVLFEAMSGPNIEVVPGGAALPAYDAHASLLDMPALCRTTAETIPASVPYLKAPRNRVERWGNRLGDRSGRFRVGIAWAGSPQQANNRNRSCTPADFNRLAAIPGVEFYSLQKERAGTVAWPVDAAAPLVELGAEIRDFADTAAIMEHLDLVLSVDTSVAHLAGALAKPAWTLLCFAADWRWLTVRDDTPWYPGMRLFRQHSAGDWSGVFDDVARALAGQLKR